MYGVLQQIDEHLFDLGAVDGDVTVAPGFVHGEGHRLWLFGAYQFQATVRQLERIYATVVASQPNSISQVYFSLEPDNVAKSNLAAAAMRDARTRAEAATQNAGATLGSVRVIDPTGRACQTDVLAGWPSYGSGVSQATTVSEDFVVTGSRMMAMAPPPPPPPAPGQAPSEAQIEAARLALQPPLQVLTDQACVVYGLN